MVPYNRTVLYRRYSTTNGTRPCIGSVPTVRTPLYRFVGQFANAVLEQGVFSVRPYKFLHQIPSYFFELYVQIYLLDRLSWPLYDD